MSPRTLRRLGVLGLTVLVFVAVLGLGVVPFRDWLDQRETLSDLRGQVADIERQNRAYEIRVDALNTDEEIERRARSEYNLVRFDEEAYAVLPPPGDPIQTPVIWPFRG
ncbi:MAG: septum formation initiator family protein [Actinobacteria bacterium]|nr:septum formation initiator family protein [Actinomycetota bacterium]